MHPPQLHKVFASGKSTLGVVRGLWRMHVCFLGMDAFRLGEEATSQMVVKKD